MGLSSSQAELQPYSNINAEYYSSHPTPTFISSAAAQYKLLSEFRGMLSFRECIYTFATLLEQFSELIRKRQGISISDQHCKVSPFGEIVVTPKIDVSRYQPSNEKYSQLIEKLFMLVNGLSIQGEWATNRSVLRLKQTAKKIVCSLGDQQQLFKHLFAQFSQFLEEANKTNLIGALSRLRQSGKRKMDSDSFDCSNKKNASFATVSIFSSSFIDNLRPISNSKLQKSTRSVLSNYNQSETQEDVSEQSSYYENMRFEDSFSSQSRVTTQFKKKKPRHRCYISPQYSINVCFNSNLHKNKKAQILKVKRDGYRTQTLSPNHYQEEKQVPKVTRNRTSVEFNQRKTHKNQTMPQNSQRSVLQKMARFVEVKQISSSRCYIY